MASFALVLAAWAGVSGMIDGTVESSISVAHEAPKPTVATVSNDSEGVPLAGAPTSTAAVSKPVPSRDRIYPAAQFQRPECPTARANQIAFSANLRRVAIALQRLGKSAENRSSYSGMVVCHPQNRVTIFRVDDPTFDAAIKKVATKEKIEVAFESAAFSLSDADKIQSFITKSQAAWSARGIEVPAVFTQADATVEVAIKGADPEVGQALFWQYPLQVRVVPEGAAEAR